MRPGTDGAYVLSGEIAARADHRAAFAACEALVRPNVEVMQRQLSPTLVRLLHPRGRAGIALTHGVERLVASRPAQALLRSRRADQDAGGFVLPSYPI